MSGGVRWPPDPFMLLEIVWHDQPCIAIQFLQERNLRLRIVSQFDQATQLWNGRVMPKVHICPVLNPASCPPQHTAFHPPGYHWGFKQRSPQGYCCWSNRPGFWLPGWASAIICLIRPSQHCRFFNPPRYAHHSSWCQCLCEDCQMIMWLKKKEAEKGVRGKRKRLNEHNVGLDSMSLGTHYDHLRLAWGAVWPLKRRDALVSGHSWLHARLLLHVWVGKTILFSEPVSSL